MFERLHNTCTKEQIYFYQTAENHKAKERIFKSFKMSKFSRLNPNAGENQGFLKCVGIPFADFISFILNIP